MWIELHDNIDSETTILINTDHVVSVLEDIIDKSQEPVTRLDTDDKESIYVSETYEEVKNILCSPMFFIDVD